MSLVTLEYRVDQRRPIITRATRRLLLVIAAAILLVALAIYFHDPTGTPRTATIKFVDARTKAPIPVMVMSGPAKGPDPWQRKITFTPPNVVQIQWVQQKTPGVVHISSPGYQGVGFELGRGLPSVSIGLWPSPPAATPPATQKPSATVPTASN